MLIKVRALTPVVSGAFLLLAGHLVPANAAVISVDVPVAVFSSYLHNTVVEITFDKTLGTLVSETRIFSGTVHDTIDPNIFGPEAGPPPGTYTVVNLVYGPNFSSQVRVADTTITTNLSTLSTSTYEPVTFDLAGFPSGVITFDLINHVTTPDNPFVPFGGGIEYLDGVLTETFTYIPAVVATVPEPPSGGMMLMSLVAAGFCAASRRRLRLAIGLGL